MKLNNNRAPGYDKITAEMIKYGPEELHQKIKSILNNCTSFILAFFIGINS